MVPSDTPQYTTGPPAPACSSPASASSTACHSGTTRSASSAKWRATSAATGSPAARRALIVSQNRSSSSVLGRSPDPGMSMAAAAKPQLVTNW